MFFIFLRFMPVRSKGHELQNRQLMGATCTASASITRNIGVYSLDCRHIISSYVGDLGDTARVRCACKAGEPETRRFYRPGEFPKRAEPAENHPARYAGF
jgi:hypothetical protein